jgi:DNA-directed RNA polymerase specialized sigma24 family protein
MEVYRRPLAVYVRGSSFARVGDPDELVHGFFADRLHRDAYLREWRESGRALRRWLLTGLRFYLMEEIRRRKSAATEGRGGDAEAVVDAAADEGEAAFLRELGQGLVREAMRRTASELESEGLGAHWRAFLLHFVEGKGYDEIGAAEGVDARRAAVMARTASRRFRLRLREIVAWPGASDEDVDAELRTLCG